MTRTTGQIRIGTVESLRLPLVFLCGVAELNGLKVQIRRGELFTEIKPCKN